MKTKLKIIAFLVLLIAFISTFQTTYSRYATSATSNITSDIARWKISLNNTDISNNYAQVIEIEPTIDSNSNVAPGKVAPGSTGYFDLIIDPTMVDVSFDYNILITEPGSNFTDLKAIGYKLCNGLNCNVASATTTAFSSSSKVVSGSMIYGSNGVTSGTTFTYNPMTIRVIFEWNDGTGSSMNDSADNAIGEKAANGESINSTFTASLSFTQKIN